MVRIIRESKALNEGPGAGYTIKGTIEHVKVNQFVITRTKGESGQVIKLDASADFYNVSVESYYYGGKIDSTPIHISNVILEVDEGEELNAYDIQDMINGTKIDHIYGGGWSHSTFDGEINADYNDIQNSYYVSGISFEFTDKGAVEYLDRAAIDGYIEPQLEVIYSDNNGTETLEVFGEDEEDKAIAWAKENGGNAVIKVGQVYRYTKRDGLILWDVDDYETIWEDENNPIIQDESLKESYVEVDTIVDGNGKEYRVVGGGFKSSDALVPVEDEDGKKTRMSSGDVAEFYTWKDSKGKVIHEPSEEEDESLKESTRNECKDGNCKKKELKEEVDPRVYDVAEKIAKKVKKEGMLTFTDVDYLIDVMLDTDDGGDIKQDVYTAMNYEGVNQNFSTGDFYTDEYAKEHPEVLEESMKKCEKKCNNTEECDEEKCEKKELNETFAGEDVISDLVDRAEGWISDGDSIDDAVYHAIDDGLIYTKDIIDLAEHYGYFSEHTQDMIEYFYDSLYSDIYSALKKKEEEGENKDDEVEESLTEEVKEEETEEEVTVDDEFTNEDLGKYIG